MFKAYIATNQYTKAFDQSRLFKKPESAMRSIKARNPRGWRDCCVWVVYVNADGSEQRF